MSNRDYLGARWWKFDFHTHTPASSDFRDPSCTAEDWLREFMQKEIDCVAITDHNSGKWIDTLKKTLQEVAREEWYRPLYLFPGVEISVHGGVHLLAIFDPRKGTGDIDSLLGAVGYDGTKGAGDGVTEKSLSEAIGCIAKLDGVAIPAHADREKGLFKVGGQTLRQILKSGDLSAIEIVKDDYEAPQVYKESKANLTEVRGSDTHGFQKGNFGAFTWVKMEEPTIEGLRLALIDGSASVIRDMSKSPNNHANFVIRSIRVKDAQYMGRKTPLQCDLSPFLNTIIGGHGSGKSSLLEFARLALRRENELSELPDSALHTERENYFHTGEDGLLTENSELEVVYRKDDTDYRVNWAADPAQSPIQIRDGNVWRDQEGEINSLFPVSIYSQKQIYELAKNPQGLLGIIDKVEDVGFDAYLRDSRDFENRYRDARRQLDQLWQSISEEKKLSGQLSDINRQIERIEKSGHKETLQKYRLRRQQLQEIERFDTHWRSVQQSIDGVLEDVGVLEIDEEAFAEHPEMLEVLQRKQKQWQQQVGLIRKNLDALAAGLRQWEGEKDRFGWMQSLRTDIQAYEKLQDQLQQQGIDPNAYSDLLRRRAGVDAELEKIRGYREQMPQIDGKADDALKKALESRKSLTQRRQKFLEETLSGNQHIGIKINAFGESWESVEEKIREILKIGYHFDADVKAIQAVYAKHGHQGVKNHIRGIYSGDVEAKDARFANNNVKTLDMESRIALRLWFPEDSLEVTYGSDRKKISAGSPGQKSAALLAFLLSYGNEPLLLDQPEDDLDHEVVSTLIVRALKASKQKRQVIVVTHNANIVVNGDSEMVHSLVVTRGRQTDIKSASLQSYNMRKQICDTVEGGEEALEQRYKRIHL